MRPETASCHERREITFPAGSSRRALSPVFVKLSFVSSERNLFTAPGARITSRISNGLLLPSLSSRNHPERFTALLPTLVISTHSFPSSAPLGFGRTAERMTVSDASARSTVRKRFAAPGVGYGVQTKSPSARRAKLSPSRPPFIAISSTRDMPGAKRRTCSSLLLSSSLVSLGGRRSKPCPGIVKGSSRRGALPSSLSSICHPQRGTASEEVFSSSIHSPSASSPSGFGSASLMRIPPNTEGVQDVGPPLPPLATLLPPPPPPPLPPLFPDAVSDVPVTTAVISLCAVFPQKSP